MSNRAVRQWLIAGAGLGLLGLVLWRADWASVAEGLVAVGWGGLAAVLTIHALSFLLDVVLWAMAYDALRPSPLWCMRLYAVRLIGEAFNNTTPLASMGGEPVKAVLLRDRYGIPYTDSGAAFVLSKTANLIGLVVFLAVGFAAMLGDGRFATGYQLLAAVGLTVLGAAIVLIFAIQRGRLATRAGRRLAASRLGARLRVPIAAAERFDRQLLGFYRQAPRRFASMLGLAFLTWLAGIFEIWILLRAAGYPATLLDAWIIEAAAQLVRTAAFFVPSGLGVVDASLVVVVGSVTGSPTAGVVVAITRRLRDLVFIGLGMLAALAPAEPGMQKPRSEGGD